MVHAASLLISLCLVSGAVARFLPQVMPRRGLDWGREGTACPAAADPIMLEKLVSRIPGSLGSASDKAEALAALVSQEVERLGEVAMDAQPKSDIRHVLVKSAAIEKDVDSMVSEALRKLCGFGRLVSMLSGQLGVYGDDLATLDQELKIVYRQFLAYRNRIHASSPLSSVVEPSAWGSELSNARQLSQTSSLLKTLRTSLRLLQSAFAEYNDAD